MAKKDLKGREGNFTQYFKNARKFLQNNNIVEAKDEIEKALEIKPNDDKALNLLGMVYFKLEEYSKAADIFRQLIKRNSNVTTLYTNLGLAYIKMEQYENAIPELKKALELESDHVSTHNYLGLAYYKLGEYELALKEFQSINATKMIEKMEQKIKETVSKATLPADIKKELHEEEAKILSAQPEEIQHVEEKKPEKEEEKAEEKEKLKVEEEAKEGKVEQEKVEEEQKKEEVKGEEEQRKEEVEKKEVPGEKVDETIPPISQLAGNTLTKFPEVEGIRIFEDKFIILGVKDSIIHSKLNNIISYRGDLQFSTEFKKFKGKETKAIFGTKESPIKKIEGNGDVILLGGDAKPALFRLEDGHIFISEYRLFAFYGKLDWENGRIQAEGSEDLNLVHLWGTGTVAIDLKSKLISMELNGSQNYTVDFNAFVGWFGKLIPQIKLIDVPDKKGNEKKAMIELKGEGILLLECISC
jgi:uncharacterized protein (AIM24 family)/thioredoxin-like negative regulator of GroEL